jgi:hypothetical protein
LQREETRYAAAISTGATLEEIVLRRQGHFGGNQAAGASKERTAKKPVLGQQRLQSTAPYVLAVIFRIGNATAIPVYGRHEHRVQGQYGGKLRLA